MFKGFFEGIASARDRKYLGEKTDERYGQKKKEGLDKKYGYLTRHGDFKNLCAITYLVSNLAFIFLLDQKDRAYPLQNARFE